MEGGIESKQRETVSNKRPDKMLTTKQVMEILSVSRTTLYRVVKNRQLKAYKFGRSLRFKEEDIKAFIEAHEKK